MAVDIIDRDKVRAIQQRLALTDKALAEMAAMPPETLSRWLRGRPPNLDTVVRLYVFLDVAGGTVR